MSDGGKLEKPGRAPVADVGRDAPSEGVAGLRPAAGLPGVMAQRKDVVDQARFRMSGGKEGTAPAAHILAERREIVGEAAARVMRKKGGGGAGAEVPKTTGAPLPGAVRAQMEPKLGADLSGVRVHTGAESEKAASGFGARAFTVGSDVHFNAGEFAPGSKAGDQLLAHELTHVVQGQKSGVQRKAEEPGGEGAAGAEGAAAAPEVSQPGEPAEQEADQVADQVAGELHGGDKKKDKAAGQDGAVGDEKAAAPGEEKGAAPGEKPAPISAKLEGVGRKVFLAGPAGGAAANAPAKAQELVSPKGNPAKEGQVMETAAPTLQLYGYGGVRTVNGVLVKDMEKELKAIEEKKAGATPDEVKKKAKYKTILDDINKTKGQDYLIFAGHIGVSIDGGATIYGFTPVAPEGMPKEQVIANLHGHKMTFPGQVKNDKPHFDLATRCATEKGWDTQVTSVTRTITTAAQAETKKKLQALAGMAPGAHGLYYSFPLSDAQAGQYFVDTPGPDGKIVKGENQANCATFPGKIGIELPEQSGNLRFFMPALRAEAAGGAQKPK